MLEVIESEGLLEPAARVGAYFQTELSKLAAIHERIGVVRGSGRFVEALDEALKGA